MELYDIFVPSGGEFNNNHTSLPFMMDEAALWNDDADSFEPIIMNDDDPEHGLNVTSFLASPSHESSLISLPFSSMSGSSSDDVTDTYSTNHLKRKPTEELEPQQPAEKKERQREQEATKGKMKRTRRRRGTVTEPQRVYAKRRREKLNEKLKTLQNLVPNGTMVDVSTMLDLAFKYVKFMQLQIKLLSSDEHWMYAPVAFNGCPPEKDLM